MYRIMFVEQIVGGVGYQLTNRNIGSAPSGRIRIACFETGFLPDRGMGYYSDTYLRQFIRKWKFRCVTRRRQLRTLALCVNDKLVTDTIRYTGDFI